MSSSCCSGNFSSRSLGSSLRCPGSSCGSSRSNLVPRDQEVPSRDLCSSCGSSRPSNLVPSRDLCSSSRCPQSPSLHSGLQVICWEPSSGRPACCSPRVSMLGSPCQTPLPGALGWGSSSSCSLGSGSGGLRPLGYGVCGVPSLSPGSGSCRPTYQTSGSCQSSCRRPACGSNCY